MMLKAHVNGILIPLSLAIFLARLNVALHLTILELQSPQPFVTYGFDVNINLWNWSRVATYLFVFVLEKRGINVVSVFIFFKILLLHKHCQLI
jgi:hypothetical protein